MIRLNEIVDRVAEYDPHADFDLIRSAYVYSAKVHEGQVRLSGEPYLTHPLEVAGILVDLRLDSGTVATGLLHDVVEDTRTTLDEIRKLFGDEVAELIDGVTKLSRMTFSSREEQQAENFRKMILAISKDIRIILIKLADRLHNMRTLGFHHREGQVRIAKETRDIYAPIAQRLGITWVQRELADLSFCYIEPDKYEELVQKVAQAKLEREDYIRDVETILEEELNRRGIEHSVRGRFKHYSSIYDKMKSQHLPFEELYDILAFRIILNNKEKCYEALGYIHALWRPFPGKFKDYIAVPKPNGYQSLHTTVFGPENKTIEIQIRTERMHRIAEEGIAAHWRYKGGRSTQDLDDTRLAWVRQILDWQQELDDPKEFLDMVKVELFPDEVYVLTPFGDVKPLPADSTPVDFAYSIHSEVGHGCVGAKVNGKIVPLKRKLQTGDVVEIITQPDHHPSRDWLKFVKTSRARAKVRHWIKQEERNRSLILGRETLDKEFRRHGMSMAKQTKTPKIDEVVQEFGFHDLEDLMATIGYGKISARAVVGRFLTELQPQEDEEEPAAEPQVKPLSGKGRDFRTGIRVQGIDNVLVHFARCCQPLPGDKVYGYITRGRGVTIHTADCPNLRVVDSNRLIPVEWETDHKGSHTARVRVLCADKKGILAAITQSLSQADVNITNAQVETTADRRAKCSFEIEVHDLRHLTEALKVIRRLKDVYEVERFRT